MKVHNYTEWNVYNKLEITLESPKTESSKFLMAVQICSGEGMGRDLHTIRCSAQVTVGLIDLVQSFLGWLSRSCAHAHRMCLW